MSEPDEILFICIGCGTKNPPRAEVCAGCGYRFAGTDVVREVPLSTARKRLENPYEPPAASIAPPKTIRIGSILIIIAVVAVCLAAFRQDVVLGVFISISMIPASIRTPLVAMSRRAAGRPMSLSESIQSFTISVLVTWVVAFSSFIAFCCTGFPAAFVTNSLPFGLIVGVVGVIAWAIWLTRLFLNLARESAAREHEIRYQ